MQISMGDHGINYRSVPNKTLQTQPLATRPLRQDLNIPHRALHRPIKQPGFLHQNNVGYGWKPAWSKLHVFFSRVDWQRLCAMR